MTEQDGIETKIGTHAPDFRLQAHTGQEIALSDSHGKSNVILFFVREYI